MKRILAVLAVIFVVAGFTAPALANSVHIKSGPDFTDKGIVLEASGTLAGLGNTNLTVNISAQANVTAVCSNKGQNQAPGQNPAPITVTGSEAIPASAVKNGNAPFDVTTTAPQTPIPGAPGCPNPNWTESITDLSFTSAIITVEQPVGTIVLTEACTFRPSTVDGPVPASSVTCSTIK